ncbi:MAG: hypothetical protein P5674_01895 [Limnospira sp. PMC 289.06]|nr:hypothetical protein [Arthrospira sp. PLM2.Bin9]MDT9181502.1 hypothetical protein [Limnospira sp. PMC 289.06]
MSQWGEQILGSHQGLVDGGFVQVCELVAAQLQPWVRGIMNPAG